MFTCGTSHYLKHTFGVGYNLTIVKKPDCDEDKLENTILAHIPSASLLTNVGAEMTYQLPFNTSDKFVALFTEFDDNGETVMFAPAEGFYATPGLGKDEMRIAYVLKKEDMRRGVELIRLGIEAYNKKKNS